MRAGRWRSVNDDSVPVEIEPLVLLELVRRTRGYENRGRCVNGLRSIDDVIDGHKASGVFDPAYWLLLFQADTRSKADGRSLSE